MDSRRSTSVRFDDCRAVTPNSPSDRGGSTSQKFFVDNCWECHKFNVAEGGIRILHHRLLVNVRKVVVPGRPEESELFQLLAPDAEGVMPPRPRKPLSKEDVEAVRKWIAEGASPFPAE